MKWWHVNGLIKHAIRSAATQMLIDYSWGRGPEWDLRILRIAGNCVCYPDVVARLSHTRRQA